MMQPQTRKPPGVAGCVAPTILRYFRSRSTIYVPHEVPIDAKRDLIEVRKSEFVAGQSALAVDLIERNKQEAESSRPQAATSNAKRGGRRHLPYAFTEIGVAMLSSVLNSELALPARCIGQPEPPESPGPSTAARHRYPHPRPRLCAPQPHQEGTTVIVPHHSERPAVRLAMRRARACHAAGQKMNVRRLLWRPDGSTFGEGRAWLM